MSQSEKNKLKLITYSNLFRKNKFILFLTVCFIGTFSFTLKAKALAPLALWGIGALVAWLGGDAVNMAIGGVENTVTYKAATGPLLAVFSWLLYSINWVISFLVGASALLLEASLKPDLFNALVRGEGLYDMWVVIRDILNLFFMMLLLFSAFATIFQVEKYHLRKIIIMLVVMALLVNFSFPISRFIVDFSNSAMYFFVDEFFSSGGIATTAEGGEVTSKTTIIAELLGIANLYQKIGTGKDEVSSLLILIIVNFISFITIFSYAISLTVRMVVLSILIAISPVGFIFAFFPATKGYADEWWEKLFKYAVSGPILVFFLMLAVVSLARLETSFLGIGVGATLPKDPSLVALVSYMVLPVTFLWVGLVASQKMGGAASNMAMGMMKKTANNIKSGAQKAAWASAGAVGRYADDKSGNVVSGTIGAAKMKLAQWNNDHKTASNTRATQFADKIGVKGANEKLVQEVRKGWKEKGGVDDAEMTKIDGSGTKAEKIALALERAENKGFDKDPAEALKQYKAGLDAIGDDKVFKDLFEGNSRKKHVDLLVRQRIETEQIKKGSALTNAEIDTFAKEEFSKLSPTQWKDQNIERLVDGRVPNGGYIRTAAAHSISGYSAKAQENLANDMGNKKYAQGQAAGLWT